MTTRSNPPAWYWIATVALVLWEAMGCYACIAQIRSGAEAMGPADAWSRQYYAALPVWYNGVYAVATFGGLFGGIAMLLRRRAAIALFWLSLAAVVVMFGYAFAMTDLIAHKGPAAVLPFPLFIAAVGILSIWFARMATRRGWISA